MPWMASLFFVHDSSLSTVQQALERALDQRVAARPAALGLADLPAPMIVTPCVEGWIAITGAPAWFDDVTALGQTLSRATAGTTIHCAVFGNCYRHVFQCFEGGAMTQGSRCPDGDWQAPVAEDEAMPLFEDVELWAYGRLREYGIPRPLIAIGTAPLGTDDRVTIDQAIALGVDGGSAVARTVEIHLPRYLTDAPPVLPASITFDFGVSLFEDRFVEGQPSAASVDRLLAIEHAYHGRVCDALMASGAVAASASATAAGTVVGTASAPAADRPRPTRDQVQLTVTYHGGAHQAALDRLLNDRGRPTPPQSARERPPWWAFWHHLGRFQ